jgi:hypothetical protein
MPSRAHKEQIISDLAAGASPARSAERARMSLEVAFDLVLCGALMMVLVVFCVGMVANLAQEGKGPQP